MSRRIVVLAFGGVGLLLSCVACGGSGGTSAPSGASPTGGSSAAPEVNPGGDIPDNQAYVAFTAADGSYTVKVPEGWSRSASGAATVFSDKLNSIRVEAKPSPAAPSAADAQATEVPLIQQSAPGFALGKVSTETRKAGPVLLLTYQADSPVDPVTGKSVRQQVERYEFWRPTTEVMVTLSSPPGADNVDPWRIVTDSFQWRP